MKRTEKYWTINFREENHDGMVRCYRRNGTESFRLLWENVADCKFAAELEVPGIYFIVEKGKDILKRPRVYVGQSTKRKNQKAMLNRVKEHKRAGEFTWADDVVFLITPPGFGPTELNYLENTFHDKIKNAGRYRCDNKVDPHNAELHEEIVGVVNDFIEDAEDILAIFGHRLFTPAKQWDVEKEGEEPSIRVQEAVKVAVRLKCVGSGAEAYGENTDDGFKVFADSKVSKTMCESFKKSNSYEIRMQLMKDKILSGRTFQKDYVFSSSSAAATVILGRSASGPKSWKQMAQ